MSSSRQSNHTPFQRTGLIVVAGGSGRRFGGFKQLVPLAGKPLLLHSLEAFLIVPFCCRVVVLPEEMIENGVWDDLSSSLPDGSHIAVAGGKIRAESVLMGLKALPRDCEFVVVHDGARPFPPIRALEDCLGRLLQDETLDGCIVASPVTDTIKQVEPASHAIERTIDRRLLHRAETPQVCRRAPLAEALASIPLESVTDEAQALEASGRHTATQLHEVWNPKITTPRDIELAQLYLDYLAKEGAASQ